MSIRLAYLSNGKLFFAEDGINFRSIDSKFAMDAKTKALEIQQRNEWKTKGRGAQFRGLSPWGAGELEPANLMVNFTGVIPANSKGEKIIYAIETDTIGGLFQYDYKNDSEKRLIHKEKFNIRDINKQPKTNKIVCSLIYSNGISNIALIENAFKDVRQITEGDSLDELPSWATTSKESIVFQSSGIARNQDGYFVGIGPYAIQYLNVETLEMRTILEDMKHDFLQPKYNSKGELFCIKRPYENNWNKSVSPFKVLKDLLFFPFRLLRAVFHYLNFFSLMYSQKPLTTAGNPKVEGPSPKNIVLHGKMIDIQKAMSKASKNEEAVSLVPKSWELVKITDGGFETLAKSVVSFDIGSDDTIVYTNGTSIYTIDADKQIKFLTKGSLIQQIIVIP
ncbi:MAG: hypothetical protein H7A23_05855 [Leptospiraceae bacterium]|nr:hypothetical protein [Leptospiraceae bacterium]MCP5494063.1 hypothetical protein [Leptospiraceae bacterium]